MSSSTRWMREIMIKNHSVHWHQQFQRISSVNTGTGVLISPNLILTAAHNITTTIEQGKKFEEYQSIRYLLAGKGKVNRQNYREVLTWKYERPWKSQDLSVAVKSDYALMLLSQSHEYSQCMKLSICCENCTFDINNQKSIGIYGYPTENKKQSFQNHKGIQQGRSFLIELWGRQEPKRLKKADFNNYRLCYQLTTFKGQSGTAVLYGNDLVAIHKGGGGHKKGSNDQI